MPRKQHVSHDFLTYLAPDKYTFGLIVINKLTTNAADFPALSYSVAVITTANTLLNDTYLAFLEHGDSVKGDFINAEIDWKKKFLKDATYVDMVADGDLALINKSGYHPTSADSNKQPHLGPLDNFTSHGNSKVGSGVVSSSVKSKRGLKAYLFTIMSKDATMTIVGNQVTISIGGVPVFAFILNTKTPVDFVGMPSLTKMISQAAGFNTAGLGDLSQAVEVSVP